MVWRLLVFVCVLVCFVASVFASPAAYLCYYFTGDGMVCINGTHIYNATNSTAFGVSGGGGGGAGGIDGVLTPDNYLLGGCVTGNCSVIMNETYLNNTIENLSLSASDTNESTKMDEIYPYVSTNHSLWDDGYSWGDHSLAGYLTSYTETDPSFVAWDYSEFLNKTSDPYVDNYDDIFTSCDNSSGCGYSTTDYDNQSLSYNAATDEITINEGNTIDITEVDTDTHNTTTEMQEAVNTTGYYQFKVNCSNIYFTSGIGSAGICDGVDASGTGGSGQWQLPTSECLYNNSDTIDINVTCNALDAEYLKNGDVNDTDTNESTKMDEIYPYVSTNHSDWDEGYSWGDHSLAGYLTSYTETDPSFVAWDYSEFLNKTSDPYVDNYDDIFTSCDNSSGCGYSTTDYDNQTLSYDTATNVITINEGNDINISEVDTDTNESTKMDEIYPYVSTNHSVWDDGYSWGDHSLAGYLTSYTETDPSFVAWDYSEFLNKTSDPYVDNYDDIFTSCDNSSGCGYSTTDYDNQSLSYNAATDEITINEGNTIDITEVDTQLTEDEVEAYIFDDDNTADLNVTGYKICFNADCTHYINGTCHVWDTGGKEGTGC